LDVTTFDVTTCAQGEDAVELATRAASAGTPFQAIVLDVRMPPGISGVEAGRRIRKLDPQVPILIVSGYSDVPVREIREQIPPEEKLLCFRKPLRLTTLATTIAKILAR